MECRIQKRNQVPCAYQCMCSSNIEATKQIDAISPSHRGRAGHPMDHCYPCPCPCRPPGLCPCAPHTKRRLPLAGDGESHGSLNFPITSINQQAAGSRQQAAGHPSIHLPAGAAGCCKSSHSPQAGVGG
jgi:hypothetical protein